MRMLPRGITASLQALASNQLNTSGRHMKIVIHPGQTFTVDVPSVIDVTAVSETLALLGAAIPTTPPVAPANPAPTQSQFKSSTQPVTVTVTNPA
jgi:hypothetical protein